MLLTVDTPITVDTQYIDLLEGRSPVSRTTRHKLIRFSAFVGLLLLTALITVAQITATPTTARAADTATAHAVRVDSPAVVRIITQFFGKLVCQGCYTDGTDAIFPTGGGFYDTGVAASGSGAFVSPDGYIMTADHVIADNPADTTVNQAIEDLAIADYAAKQGVSVSSATALFQANDSYITYTHQLKTNIFLSTSYTGTLQSVNDVKSFPLGQVVAQSPVDQQDTAIIKIATQDMPFLTLAPPDVTHAGDTVTALAYPGDADVAKNSFTALLDPSHSDVNTLNGLLARSVNTGQVTGIKTDSTGTLLYETNDIGYHGSSGGPVVDTKGRIVGFVDSGSSATSSSRVVYLISSPVIAKYTAQAGIPTQPTGAFMTRWLKLNNDIDATTNTCHLTNAKNDLAVIDQNYAGFGGKQEAAQLIPANTPATCSTGPSRGTLAAIGGGILAVILLIVAAVFLSNRNKSTYTQPAYGGMQGGPIAASTPYPYTTPTYPDATPYGGYPPSMPQQQYPGYQPTATQQGATPQAPYPGYQPPSPQYPSYPQSMPQQGAAPQQAPQYPSYPQQQPQYPSYPQQGVAPQPPQYPSYPQQGAVPQQPQYPSYPQQGTVPQQPQYPSYSQGGPQQGAAPQQPQYGYPASGSQPAQYPPSGPQQGAAPPSQYGSTPSTPQQPSGYVPNVPSYGAPDAAQQAPTPNPASESGQQQSSGPQQSSPAAPQQQPVARYCVNGHLVTNPQAQFCTECGAPMNPAQ